MASPLQFKIDVGPFRKAMNRLKRNFTADSARVMATALAQSLITDAVEAPVPRDTGKLAASGFVERRGDGVIFGFNTEYAAVQDVGTIDWRRVPPKAPKKYGSDIGPNRYFSETLRRKRKEIPKRLAVFIEERMKKAQKK